jgi:hypothetical protein
VNAWSVLDRWISTDPHLYRTRRWSFYVVLGLVLGVPALVALVYLVAAMLGSDGWGY